MVSGMKSYQTLEEYIEAALATARYERIEDGTKVYAELPAFRGVWADGPTREVVRRGLRSVLEGWIELQVERKQTLPAIGGVHPPSLSFA
jgi:predicted RNase H-like HicB family nuclease